MSHCYENEKQISVTCNNLKCWSLLISLGIIGIATIAPAIAATQVPVLSIFSKGDYAITQEATSEVGEVTIEGQIDESSATLENGSYYNVHTFEGQAEEQIVLELSSEEFDTYVILLDPDGRVIDEDNDSGSGTDALLVVTLPSKGIYRVLVNTYGTEETGSYRLQWRSVTNAAQDLDQAIELNQDVIQLYSSGRYGEAIPLAEKVLELRRRVLGENHPEVTTSLNNLALLYREQGQYAEAEALYQQALEISRSTLGENHPEVATSLNNLALLYREQGQYAEAISLYQQALEISRSTLGENHPNVAISSNNLALLYQEQGQYAEAISLYQQALEISRSTLGENHPNVVASLINLALLYREQGQYAEAIPLYQQALEISRSTLGENHPNVAISFNNLALLYQEQGQYAEAEALYQQALEISRSTLGENHPNVVTSLINLALLYQGQGQYVEAEALYQQALEISRSTLGENHPEVVAISNDLAGLNRLLGLEQIEQSVMTDDRPFVPTEDEEPLIPALRSTARIIARVSEGNLVGAGWVVKRQGNIGWVVTNRHVVSDTQIREVSDRVQVEFFSELEDARRPRYEAVVEHITGFSDELDLAVLRVEGIPDDIRPLTLRPGRIRRLTQVQLIGHPFNVAEPWAAILGEVVSYNPNSRTFSIDALVAQGNSGGPVVNENLEVVGMMVTKRNEEDIAVEPNQPTPLLEATSATGGVGVAYRIEIVQRKLQEWGILED